MNASPGTVGPRTPGLKADCAMKLTPPYEYALNLLAARAYTERNLRRKLAQRGFSAGESDETIERLKEKGYVDDARYAAEFARQRLVVAGASVRRVEQDLAKKGISREVARGATEQILEEEPVDTISAIERIAKKRLLSAGDLESHVLRRRVFGFLARKGYGIDDINAVLDRLIT